VRATLAAELSPDIDYVEVVDPQTLEPVERITGPVVIAVAVRLPGARLIDNVRAEPPPRGAEAAANTPEARGT